MNKCRLCQQLNNNLTNVYHNDSKSLAHMLLKLKGFEDSLEVNQHLAVCGNCTKGLENLTVFWDTIPDAKSQDPINIRVIEEFDEQEQTVPSNAEENCVLKQNLSPVLLGDQGQYKYEYSFTNIETNSKGFTLQKKLSRKRKRAYENICTTATGEILQKRIRRRPKRYENFSINSPEKVLPRNENSSVESNIINEQSLKELPQMAILRSSNGQDIGTLVEVKSGGISYRMRIICQICCQIFSREKEFQAHWKIHQKNQLAEVEFLIKNYLFYCKICDKSFPEHCAVRRHFKQAHSKERPFKCQHCEASFKYKFNFDYHMAKHVPKTRFECVFCKKTFLMRYELQIHLRTHTKEKPYKCEFCSFSFSHRSNLKSHQKVKHFKKTVNQTNVVDSANVTDYETSIKNFKGFIFKPPEILLEEKVKTQTDLSDKNVNKSLTLSIFEDPICDLKNDKINSLETENTSEHIDETETKLVSTNESRSLKLLEAKEICEKYFKAQQKLASFQLDSSLLKALPSPTLLGLKKWPKSFQGTSFTALDWAENCTYSDIKNSNSFKIEEMTRKKSENRDNYSLCDATAEYDSHCLDTENMTENLKSIVLYNPAQTNFCENSVLHSTQITNSTFSCNISNSPQTAEIYSSSNANFKTTNRCKFLNTSKHPRSPIGLDQIKNKFESMESSLSIKSTTDNSKPWKVVNVSTKPVKMKNILNLKVASTNPLTGNSTVSDKATDKNSNEMLTKFKEFFEKSQQSSLNCLTNVAASCSSSTPNLKYTKNSERSLLKPIIKSQRISSTNLHKIQNILPEKPLITKMEILPPLEPIKHSQKSDLPNSPSNLIKPPTEYKYQCCFCYKYFKQRSPLTKHIRTHTGEKPYKCNLCNKSYTDASNYSKHKRLHKSAAEALIISTTTAYAVPNSPAYSTVSDPDPDGVEIMQTIRKFGCSSTDEDDIDDDDASLSSSTMESRMWQDALENALMNEEIRDNIRRNLQGINNGILPKCLGFSTKDPD